MGAIFTPEEERGALEVLDSLRTAQNAVGILLQQADSDDPTVFLRTASVLMRLLDAIETSAKPYAEKQNYIILPQTCQSAKLSLQEIVHSKDGDLKNCVMKLQYELLPILEEAYMQFYYWAHVHGNAEREKLYFEKELYELASNRYANTALETGKFAYEVSFLVIAYNKVDYTRQCVESLLRNIPKDLSYELILWDNGSTDDTANFFRSICPTKLFQARINYATGLAVLRAAEGKYLFSISNDVVILPGTIENMLACIRSAEDIAWVVPSTPNVSNLQAIPASYENRGELEAFARENNKQDPFRWEQRVRLCDPLGVRRMLLTNSRKGVCADGYPKLNFNDFPDDRLSLLLRRNGYRAMLAKDAYCFHFGSVTLENEVDRQGKQKFYDDGRRRFYGRFGVDPWGTGFCFDPVFLERRVGEHTGHVEVLGINCGLGSNSLKIKEQIKEYCHNTDCALFNITDDAKYVADLKGIGNDAEYLTKFGAFDDYLRQKSFDYIVWEDPFLIRWKFKSLLAHCMEHLAQDGTIFIKVTEQSERTLRDGHMKSEDLGNGWRALRKE